MLLLLKKEKITILLLEECGECGTLIKVDPRNGRQFELEDENNNIVHECIHYLEHDDDAEWEAETTQAYDQSDTGAV